MLATTSRKLCTALVYPASSSRRAGALHGALSHPTKNAASRKEFRSRRRIFAPFTRRQVPFLALSFLNPAVLRTVLDGWVSATGSEAGKVSRRASSSISSSVGRRFHAGFSAVSPLCLGTSFMALSEITRMSGRNVWRVDYVAVAASYPTLTGSAILKFESICRHPGVPPHIGCCRCAHLKMPISAKLEVRTGARRDMAVS